MAEGALAASGAAATPTRDGQPDLPARIRALFRQTLSRDPDAAETALAADFLQSHDNNLVLLAQSLLLTNEFWFVD